MYSVCNDLKGRVSPFGNLRIKACLLAPRSLSQATTSFIACNRQGIHHVHLFTCPYNVSPLRLNKGAVIEIRSTTLLRLLIHTIITHRIRLSAFAINKNLLTSSRLLKNVQHLISKRSNLNTRDSRCLHLNFLVEDDGIEPTTPCLQSRCSPS